VKLRKIETRTKVANISQPHSLIGPLPEVQLVRTSLLKPNPRNARTHSKKQVRQIINSILRFKWTYPILVDDDDVIIAGHGRYLAALELGLKEVPIIVMTGLNELEKRALALADNKIAANAGWDRKILATELGELAATLPEYNLDLDITGFEPAEFDALMGDMVETETDPADELPAVAKAAVTRRGHLWLLGPHRLYCGDACNQDDLRTLMSRDTAAMVFADPPYNVRISSVQGRGKIKHREFPSASGEMSPEQFTKFHLKWMSLAGRWSDDGAVHFVCSDWRHLGEALAAGNEVYTELKNLVVWNKSNAGQGSFYRSQHELIFAFKNGEGPHQNNVELGRHGRNRSNVWNYAGVNTFRAGRLDELSVHPTVKPVALVADAMRDCSRRGDIILDPFMGSGTTILAAERVGRRAYGLEIDPLYVDVAIRRWQEFTRKDAILKATGQTFDEVATSPAVTRIRAAK
jgi:DNA modification methylase